MCSVLYVVCVESTARYDELVSVCGTQTKPRSDVGRCDEIVGVRRSTEVPDREDSGTPWVHGTLWHVQPMKLVVEEWRQTAMELPCVTDHTGGSIEHSLQLVGDPVRLRRPCIDCVAIVDARRNKSMHENCRWSIIQWLPCWPSCLISTHKL